MAYSANTLIRASELLGYRIQDGTGEREYTCINGVLYTDLFTGTPTIDGYEGTFKTRFNGKQGTAYFNEIVLDDDCSGLYSVAATWGSSTFITEVDGLLMWLEQNTFADMADDAGIQSKKIEDFSVTKRSAAETNSSYYDAIRSAWSYYIRNVLIISVASEQHHDYRYF